MICDDNDELVWPSFEIVWSNQVLMKLRDMAKMREARQKIMRYHTLELFKEEKTNLCVLVVSFQSQFHKHLQKNDVVFFHVFSHLFCHPNCLVPQHFCPSRLRHRPAPGQHRRPGRPLRAALCHRQRLSLPWSPTLRASVIDLGVGVGFCWRTSRWRLKNHPKLYQL